MNIPARDYRLPAQSLLLVGSGGTIASHLAPHTARMGYQQIHLLDSGFYESKDVRCQAIEASDVGKAKARVQARRLRRTVSGVHIVPTIARAEDLPLGRLQMGVIVSCVDSRATRQYLNQVAWRLNLPLVDAAVDATGLYARCNVYLPAANAPCLECAWGQQDYAALEQEYPCQAGARREAPPTNAPAALGALAAALAAIELEKMLQGRWAEVLVAQQLLVDARHHRHYVTSFSRNPACRFDHGIWQIVALKQAPRELSVQQLLDVAGAAADAQASLAVAGQVFVTRLFCRNCCRTTPGLFRLERRLAPLARRCQRCHGPLVARGFDKLDRLPIASLPAWTRRATLQRLGIRRGDIVTVLSAASERHFLLANNGRDEFLETTP
jgi:molybdopterin/thiamine biosynthesis adenylyltransferase